MYEFFRGKLVHIAPAKAVIDVGGIGFCLSIGLSTYSRLPKIGEEVLLFTAFVVREDSQTLFGFYSQGERDFFLKLNTVSGIGPKTALALISHCEISDLQLGILHGNAALLSKIPGIGKKTAERLIVELRDKIEKDPLVASVPRGEKTSSITTDAISALINLGFHPLQAQRSVKKAQTAIPDGDLGKLITAALKIKD